MRILIVSFLCTVFFCAGSIAQSTPIKKQNHFRLIGQVLNRDTGFIILSYQDTSKRAIIDTTEIKNGQFYFSGYIHEPTYATLNFPEYQGVSGDLHIAEFFMEPTEIVATLSSENLRKSNFQGSKTQLIFEKYLAEESVLLLKWKTVLENHERLLNQFSLLSEGSVESKALEDSLDLMTPKLKMYNKELEELKYRFITNHPNTYVSAYLLTQFRNRPALTFQKKIYEGFSEEIKNSRYAGYIREDIEKRKLVAEGALIPDFSIANNEKEVRLSSMKGKYVLLDFWASWCVPCRQEIPELKLYYEKYHPKGFEIVTISIDRQDADWKRALREEEIPQFYNVRSDLEISKYYENVFRPIPSKILVNRDGIIIWKQEYEGTTANKSLKAVLGEEFDH